MHDSADYYPWLPLIDWAACNGCGDCVVACPTGALGLVDGKATVLNPHACNYTASCEAVCPVAAIALPYEIVLRPAASRSRLASNDETNHPGDAPDADHW